MPVITITDLHTHLYPEVIAEICRGNDDIASQAIETATREAALYLGRYNLPALLGNETGLPDFTDALLQQMIKDIACWHLLRLSNTQAEQALFRQAYLDTLKKLDAIRCGLLEPAGWPYATQNDTAVPPGDAIAYSSNNKRENHY